MLRVDLRQAPPEETPIALPPRRNLYYESCFAWSATAPSGRKVPGARRWAYFRRAHPSSGAARSISGRWRIQTITRRIRDHIRKGRFWPRLRRQARAAAGYGSRIFAQINSSPGGESRRFGPRDLAAPAAEGGGTDSRRRRRRPPAPIAARTVVPGCRWSTTSAHVARREGGAGQCRALTPASGDACSNLWKRRGAAEESCTTGSRPGGRIRERKLWNRFAPRRFRRSGLARLGIGLGRQGTVPSNAAAGEAFRGMLRCCSGFGRAPDPSGDNRSTKSHQASSGVNSTLSSRPGLKDISAPSSARPTLPSARPKAAYRRVVDAASSRRAGRGAVRDFSRSTGARIISSCSMGSTAGERAPLRARSPAHRRP